MACWTQPVAGARAPGGVTGSFRVTRGVDSGAVEGAFSDPRRNMAGTFEPDALSTSIEVQLHTAALSDASTAGDIFLERLLRRPVRLVGLMR